MTKNNDDLLSVFLENTNEGYIAINEEGIIEIYNKKAREIFGIDSTTRINHPKGKIKTGDIVIIADTRLGEDDGNLNNNSLQSIGIYDNSIRYGDAIIAIGVYNEPKIKSQYKVFNSNSKSDYLSFNTYFQGEKIRVFINKVKRRVNIEVLDDNYYMNYFHSIGHMIILDANDHSLKFCQDNGYTARQESINDILLGSNFRGKGSFSSDLNVINHSIYNFHTKSDIIEKFIEVSKGKNIIFKNRFEEINGFPTLCSLFPVRDINSSVKALLKIEDISEINKIIEERNFLSQELSANIGIIENIPPVRKLFPSMSGNSLAMQSVKKLAWISSRDLQSVTIMGPSGVGKRTLARNIHKNSKNKDAPFVHLHCEDKIANFIDHLLYGEDGEFIFLGALESCEGGTIYISNIETIPLEAQTKLYQVLKSGSFFRNNGKNAIKFRGRLIASTSRNLEEEVSKGKFDEQLYNYIQTYQIWIPPLKYRKKDILALINDLTEEICREQGINSKNYTKDALNFLISNDWGKNVDELKSVLKETISTTKSETITEDNLNILEINKSYTPSRNTTMKEFLDFQEKELLKNTLLAYDGNKKEAMAQLDMSKTTFYNKLKKYNLD